MLLCEYTLAIELCLVGGTMEDGKNHNKFLEINQKESINNQEIALGYLRLSNDLIRILHTPGQDSQY